MENVQQQTEQARALERAERFDAAREVYGRLATEEGEHRDDPAFWLHLADLEARAGASDEVLGHYARAIDLFEAAGQRNNAIALCHRVLALAPDETATRLRLGRLAAALGYARDAREAIDGYARRMEEAGAAEEALRALRALLVGPPGDAYLRDAIARLSGGAPAPAAPEPEPAEPEEDDSYAALPTLPGLDEAPDGDEGDLGLEPVSPADELPTLGAAPDLAGADLGLEPTSLDEEGAADADRFAPLEGLETTHAADDWGDPPAAPAPPAPRDEPEDLPLIGLAPEDEPAPIAEPLADDSLEADQPDDGGDLPLLAPAPDGADEEDLPAPDDGDYVDLGALILSDDEDDSPSRVPPAPPAPEEDRDFEEILALFREKIDREIDEGDAASHYDLGLAFKEMGLLDDAVARLQAALRGGANPLATLEVLGECFVEKGEPEVAEQVLSRATRLHGAGEADLLGVRYWLGRCHEAQGRADEARADYEGVTARDPAFRDAAERLDRLRAGPGSDF